MYLNEYIDYRPYSDMEQYGETYFKTFVCIVTSTQSHKTVNVVHRSIVSYPRIILIFTKD